jgi:hypothetical protein
MNAVLNMIRPTGAVATGRNAWPPTALLNNVSWTKPTIKLWQN